VSVAGATALTNSPKQKEGRLSSSTDHDPSFEQDIRPRFRPMDVEEMSFAFDLSSYDEVRENAEGIYERLANGTMPCDAPWSEDDLDRFRAWIDAGMPA
jgi:hypothetical protein